MLSLTLIILETLWTVFAGRRLSFQKMTYDDQQATPGVAFLSTWAGGGPESLATQQKKTVRASEMASRLMLL